MEESVAKLIDTLTEMIGTLGGSAAELWPQLLNYVQVRAITSLAILGFIFLILCGIGLYFLKLFTRKEDPWNFRASRRVIEFDPYYGKEMTRVEENLRIIWFIGWMVVTLIFFVVLLVNIYNTCLVLYVPEIEALQIVRSLLK